MATSKPKRRPRRSTATVRALILQAAREAFSERGYGGATTRDIAARADTNEVLLFRHFSSKARLFEEAVFEPFKGFMDDFSRRYPPAARPAVAIETETREFVEGLYQVLYDNRRLMMALMAASLYEPEIKSSLADIDGIRDYFTSAEGYIRREGIETKMNVATGVRLSFGLVAASVLMSDWLYAGEKPKRSRRRTIDDLSAFINGGLQGAAAGSAGRSRPS